MSSEYWLPQSSPIRTIQMKGEMFFLPSVRRRSVLVEIQCLKLDCRTKALSFLARVSGSPMLGTQRSLLRLSHVEVLGCGLFSCLKAFILVWKFQSDNYRDSVPGFFVVGEFFIHFLRYLEAEKEIFPRALSISDK